MSKTPPDLPGLAGFLRSLHSEADRSDVVYVGVCQGDGAGE